MAYSFMGIGTLCLGRRDFESDGSYVTTEWISFLYHPIFPLRSYKMREKESSVRLSTWFPAIISYSMSGDVHRVPLNWKQVMMVYGYICLLWSALVFAAYVIGIGRWGVLPTALICLGLLGFVPTVLRGLPNQK